MAFDVPLRIARLAAFFEWCWTSAWSVTQQRPLSVIQSILAYTHECRSLLGKGCKDMRLGLIWSAHRSLTHSQAATAWPFRSDHTSQATSALRQTKGLPLWLFMQSQHTFALRCQFFSLLLSMVRLFLCVVRVTQCWVVRPYWECRPPLLSRLHRTGVSIAFHHSLLEPHTPSLMCPITQTYCLYHTESGAVTRTH